MANVTKQQFYLKLNPPRPTFMMDMTEDEKTIMQKHVEYWTKLLNEGIAIVFGPVMDPAGVYGVGVVLVDSEEVLKWIINNDPANGINKYEYFPMRAIFK